MKSGEIHMPDEEVKRQIMIVDDDKDFADSLLDILELEGYECEVSNSVTRALQKIKHFEAQVALIDIRLGRSSGIDLIARLKKARPHVLCVMITAYAALETATQALQEGAYDYLRKPVNFQDLMCTLDRCFDKLQLEREKATVDMALRIRNQELEEINARLRKTVESIKRMSSWSNMTQMGPLLLEEFSSNMTAEGGSLFLSEGEGLVLLHTLDPGHAPDYIPFPLKEGTIFHRAMAEGKPILIHDIQKKNTTISSSWNGYKDGSLLVFPLKDEKGEMMGIVSLHNKLLPPFRSQDLELGSILASYCCESLRATRSAEALHESEERYRGLFEKSRDAIFITTLDGQIVEANKSALELFGHTVDELIGLNALDFYVDFHQRAQLRHELSQKGFVRDFQVNFHKKDGTPMDCLLTATLRRSNDRRILELQGIVRDVSESNRLQAQLLQAQKMEAIGILAGGVAHDFNNLLTTIQGYTDLTMMRIDESDPLYRNLKQIRRASLRAADLTRQLLLFSRKQPMEFTSLNINKTVDNMFKMIKRLISEDIAINKDLQSGSWIIRADQGNIEQVIMNLVVNARDAMPNGGVLTIKTELVQLDEGYSKMYDYARPGRFVCLSISDSGIGMSRETVQHIFEPFFTTKGPGEGSGLGLSVVYGIVKKHQGWINVYSEPGQGSTFRIYLPVTFEKQEYETNNIPPLHELQGNKKRVLLVEDEEGVREFAASALRENGYIVVEAASAGEAIDIFDREEKNFHLVFSDVVLHDGSGIQLVEKLLCHNRCLRILLSSGYADDKSKWPIIRDRGFSFLQKPYSLYELLRAIKEVVRENKNNLQTD